MALGYLPSSLLRSLRCPERNGALPHGQVPVPASGLHWAVCGHVPEQSPEGCHSQGGEIQVTGAGTCHCSVPRMMVIFPFLCPITLPGGLLHPCQTFTSNHPLSLS